MGGTTGVSLEQARVSRTYHESVRAVGPDKRGSSPEYDFIIYKTNPSSPGLGSSVPGFRFELASEGVNVESRGVARYELGL